MTARNQQSAMAGSSRRVSVLPCALGPKPCTAHYIKPIRPPEKSIKKLFLSILPISSGKQSSEDTKPCHLLALPVELILEIATHLEIYEQVLLSLTCKALHTALGIKLNSTLPLNDSTHQSEFLTLLHRDLPSYRLCIPCNKLHNSSGDTIALPQNKLRRTPWHPAIKACLFRPFRFGFPDPVYWLSDEHVRRVLAKQICTSTLHCSGVLDLSAAKREHPVLEHGSCEYWIKPVISRGCLIYHAVYEIKLLRKEDASWSQDDVKDILRNLDLRCCLHCSTSRFLAEMICLAYHPLEVRPDGPICAHWRIARRAEAAGEGCDHHGHADGEGACQCVTDSSIENISNRYEEFGAEPERRDRVFGWRVTIWQWLGGGRYEGDMLLRYKGVLRNLYEDAVFESAGDTLGTDDD